MLSMKKYRLWALAVCALSLTALPSCKSDLLDLKPLDHYGTNNYWNNHAQVEANYQALNGILRGNYSVFRAFGELRAGTMKFTVSATGESQSSVEVKQSVLDADRPGLLNWGGFYGDLLHINLFIKKVETQCPFLTDAERKTYLGKAYGIRAYIYFVLYGAPCSRGGDHRSHELPQGALLGRGDAGLHQEGCREVLRAAGHEPLEEHQDRVVACCYRAPQG